MIFTTRMNAMMVVIFINFSSTNPDNDKYAAYHDIMIIVIVIVISVIFTLSFAFRTDRASTSPSRTQPAHRYSLMVIMMVMIMMITWMIVIVTMIIIGTKPVRM